MYFNFQRMALPSKTIFLTETRSRLLLQDNLARIFLNAGDFCSAGDAQVAFAACRTPRLGRSGYDNQRRMR